jgi:peptide/nickel transport system substrate-binding protein
MFRSISKRATVLLVSFVITASGLAMVQTANAATSARCNLNTKVANAVCDEIVYGAVARVSGLDRKTASGGGYVDSQMAYITQGQLYRFDENLVPRRDLVTKKVTSKDGLTITLSLRNARYSDGTPVRAQDAVVSYQRWVASNQSPAYIQKVETIREVNLRTLEIKLKSKYPDVDFALASEFFGLHPYSRVNTPAKAAAYFRNPVSAGPMKVKTYTPGSETFVAEANSSYWAKPVVKELKVVHIPDATSRQLALQQGTIDYVFELPLTAQSQAASSTVKIFPHFDPGTFMLAINMRADLQPNAALKDARVRRAISLAVDRNQIMRVAFANLAKPNCGMQFNVNNPLYVCSLPKDGARDLAAARQLMQQAGYANGFKMTLIYPNRVLWPEANAIVKSNLAEIGIDVTLRPEPDANVGPILNTQRNWEIMWFGNNAATPILQLANWFAIGGLWAGFVGKGVATDPGDVELNRLLDEANTVPNVKKRRDLLLTLEKKAFESSHFIPIGTRYRLSGTKIAPGIAQPQIPGDLWFHIGTNPPLPKK